MSPRGTDAGQLVFAGDGDLARRLREFDWSQSALGPVESWPQSLKTCVRIMLTARQPMFVWWGDELINLYNDAYRTILQGKHPWALGQEASVVWREIWDQVGPRAEQAMRRDEGTYDEALLLIMERNGYPEETYYTFSYSPVPNDQGGTGGIICANTDDTQRIVGERQLALLRELAAGAANARSREEACALSASCFKVDRHDVPFALIYLADPASHQFTLAGSSGMPAGHPSAPATIPFNADSIWPLDEAIRDNRATLVTDLSNFAFALPAGAWDRPPDRAIVIPIGVHGQHSQSTALVIGLNPYRPLDEKYRGFLELVASQIGSAIHNAHEYEEERKRVEALAEIDRAKTLFFSNVSHEFRTPLTLLLGPVEDLLARLDERDQATREPLEVIHRNALRLLKLVNSLLDFARIEAGRVRAEYVPTDLGRLTADLASSFRAATERAGLRLSVDCQSLAEPAYVDRDMWEKIVLNLLSNAFKYTFDGEIGITLRQQGRTVALEIRDTGVGIPETELPRLFERFHRVEGTRARTHEGSGIGLALVQELVRLHGGTIKVESVVDRGSTFTVTIPLGVDHLPKDRVAPAPSEASTSLGATAFVEEALRWIPETDLTRPGLAPVSSPDLVGVPRILVADDNADMREYVQRLLSQYYNVETVADGQEALAAVHAHRPDLVVADVMMPNLDGFGLLRSLRENPATSTLPIILLSARAGEESRVEGLNAGADDYLIKPFGAREMLARVGATLELSRVRRDTEKVIRDAMLREQIARSEAEAAHQWLHDLFMQAPALICILRGPEHVYELANPLYLQLVGNRHILGKPIREALPELAGQGIYELLDQAYQSGEQYLGTELPVQLDRHGDGTTSEVFINFVYHPFRNREGQVEGIMVHGVEVTEQVRARREIEAALRARDEFLSVAAHELKTPVTSIKGGAQLLARIMDRGILDETRLRRHVATITESADRLASLTNDLLDVSRIQTGRLALHPTTFDLRDLVASSVDRFRDTIDERYPIRLSLPTCACIAEVDAARIDQILVNLLDNAVKYSPNGSPIDVSLIAESANVTLRVRDSGIGVPEDNRETIFEPFGRADNAVRDHMPGMGLGLYICRRIAEQHGGQIWAESSGEHQGTTMVVTLPRLVGA